MTEKTLDTQLQESAISIHQRKRVEVEAQKAQALRMWAVEQVIALTSIDERWGINGIAAPANDLILYVKGLTPEDAKVPFDDPDLEASV